MRRSNSGAGCGPTFTVLAAVFALLTCLTGIAYAVLFADPQLNPVAALRPPTEVALLPISTLAGPASSTPGSLLPTLPPEWTPTDTPTITNTPPPTDPATQTPTRTPNPPTKTATPTVTRTPTPTNTGPTPTPSKTRSAFNYTKTADTPAYLPNFANSNGCAWFGVSGQVFDLNRLGALGLIVRVTGPNSFQADSITGGAPKYGASGFEITLGTTPVDSSDYRIQLRNGAGQALSDNIVLTTSKECNRNHILVNFEQNH